MTQRGTQEKLGEWARRACALLLAIAFVLAGVVDASAKRKDSDKKDRRQYTLNADMAKKLTAVRDAMEADQFDEAKRLLTSLEKKGRSKKYELALLHQFQGYVAANQDDHSEAIRYFEKCIAVDYLPPAQQLSLRFNIAQLYLATEDFQAAVDTLKIWFTEAEKPNSNAYYYLAIAYYQLEQYDEAIVPAETAVKLTGSPKSAWLQLLTSLYYMTERYSDAVAPLEMLIVVDPQKRFWTQLSSLYANLQEENKSLAVMQLAYQQGFLGTGIELRQLAQLYLYHDLPYRAALVLEKGFKEEIVEKDADNWEMLANSWLLAQELDRALGPLETAAELAEGGELFDRLGRVRFEREDWSGAIEALMEAGKRGDLRDKGTNLLVIGMAYYNMKQTGKAREYFRRAKSASVEGESAYDAAAQWMQLLEREDAQRQRRAAGG